MPGPYTKELLAYVPPQLRSNALEILDIARFEAQIAGASPAARRLIEPYILARWLGSQIRQGHFASSEAESLCITVADRCISDLHELDCAKRAQEIVAHLEQVGQLEQVSWK
ncbi:MAG: hypothetical protein ABL879_02255 [Devosia sp.]